MSHQKFENFLQVENERKVVRLHGRVSFRISLHAWPGGVWIFSSVIIPKSRPQCNFLAQSARHRQTAGVSSDAYVITAAEKIPCVGKWTQYKADHCCVLDRSKSEEKTRHRVFRHWLNVLHYMLRAGADRYSAQMLTLFVKKIPCESPLFCVPLLPKSISCVCCLFWCESLQNNQFPCPRNLIRPQTSA